MTRPAGASTSDDLKPEHRAAPEHRPAREHRVAPEHPPDKLTWLWRGGRVLCRVVTTLFWDLKSYGRDNIPASGPVLLVSNHQSFLDPVLIAVHLSRPMSYLARHGLFVNPFLGWLIRNLNAFPIRQGESDVGAVKETIRRLHEGHMLNLYPEGSRTEDGRLQPMQPGVALVIRKAAVPVVPAAIEGSFNAWPRGRKFPRPGLIRVIYGPPIYGLHEKRPKEILQILETRIGELLEQLRAMDHWTSP